MWPLLCHADEEQDFGRKKAQKNNNTWFKVFLEALSIDDVMLQSTFLDSECMKENLTWKMDVDYAVIQLPYSTETCGALIDKR